MRMNSVIGLVSLFLLFTLNVQGAEIKWNNPAYAGSSFSFYTIPNFLTEKQEMIGEGTVQTDGTFTCTIALQKTSAVYCDFDVYKGWLVLNPNDVVELVLPPREEKKSSNPYFRPKVVHFGVKGVPADNINLLIANFTRQYNLKMSQNMQQIFYRRSLETAETVVAELQSMFPATSNEYLENFKKYKYASVKYTALIQDPTPIIEEYFINQPILYDHPDYAELFDKLFPKYLQYATQQTNGQKISVMLNSGSYEQLLDWLTLDMLYDKSMAEAIVLKGIKPLFYSKRFNTAGLFSILQKITDTSKMAVHQSTSKSIFNELARTMYGAIAPALDLIDINGNFVSWETFTGKYVYLCFTRTDNEKFAAHKDLMKQFQITYAEDLAVVVVIEDDQLEKNAALLKNVGFEWTVLRGMTRKEIYENYNVRILPTYFLIDPQGRMAGSQAPWPDENFEMQFSNILKATKD
jgi:peroxiredoxin